MNESKTLQAKQVLCLMPQVEMVNLLMRDGSLDWVTDLLLGTWNDGPLK